MAGKEQRSWFVSPLIAAIALFVVVLLRPSFSLLELSILDSLFRLRGSLDVKDSPIVLVAISEQADDEMPQRWPWPRSYFGRLVENLNKAGAKTIAIDVRFDKADVDNSKSDSMFAQVLTRYDNVILAGNIIRMTNQDAVYSQVDPPYELFNSAIGEKWGFVSVQKDADSGIRRYWMSQNHSDKTFYPLGVMAVKHFLDIEKEPRIEGGLFRLGDLEIPLTSDGETMFINYHGGIGTFPEYNFDEVIDDEDFFTSSEDEFFQMNSFDDPDIGHLANETFKDKLVLVGATMAELHDFYATPFAPQGNQPGYETHANAIQTILSGNYLRDIDNRLVLLFALGLSLLIVFCSTKYSIYVHLPLALFLIFGYAFLSVFLFMAANMRIAVITPMALMFFSYSGVVAYDYMQELREKRRIKGMFSTYVSPALVERMIESGEEPKLGGDEVFITAFFSDITSFSTFSELLTPKQLVDLINEYLTAMSDILTEHDGTLDKYIGDAMVAFFGAPFEVKDHAYKACLASQYMQLKQAELRQKWKSEGGKWPGVVAEMTTRIGLNTGNMVTGNMGSNRRFNYTMMGDNVNLAARCESGGKSYGVLNMVTQSTRDECLKHGQECVFRFLDKIVVKGRSQPVEMYEIMGLKTFLNQRDVDCKFEYEQGFEAYLDHDFDKAINHFEQSKDLEIWTPGTFNTIKTNPSLVMLDRCHHLKQSPPQQNWDGVFEMTSK